MIKLVPLEKSEALENLCEAYGLVYQEGMHAYVSASEQVKAQCVFRLQGYDVELLAASFEDSDPLIPEMLIRAVGAYAANRSGYVFHINKSLGQAMQSTLKTMHFEENENEYYGKVPKILAGTCCHNK